MTLTHCTGRSEEIYILKYIRIEDITKYYNIRKNKHENER